LNLKVVEDIEGHDIGTILKACRCI
jgi:hypothetical protein